MSISYTTSISIFSIYMYVFTNLLSTSIHGYQEKEKKNTRI